MKYVSIDIETTGLDPENCQVLSIGAVIEDTQKLLPLEELPRVHIAIRRENISGSMFAINMNRALIEQIVDFENATITRKEELRNSTDTVYVREDEAVRALFHFLYEHGGLDVTDTEGWSHAAINDAFERVPSTDKEGKMVLKSFPALTSKMKPYVINAAGKNFASFDIKFLERLPRWKQVFKVRSRILDPGVLFVDWKNDDAVPGMSECKKRANLPELVTHHAVEDAIDVIMLLRTTYA
jgi:hypothetical protein